MFLGCASIDYSHEQFTYANDLLIAVNENTAIFYGSCEKLQDIQQFEPGNGTPMDWRSATTDCPLVALLTTLHNTFREFDLAIEQKHNYRLI